MEQMIFGKLPDGSGDGYGSGSGYGYGYGSGSGSGSGYGDGSGYGYGYGYGSGDGYGYGYGYGDGYGYGYGYGDGSGDGSGYGDGSGDGSGYGSGSKEYWTATIPYFVKRWPENQRARYESLCTEGATIAFWRSDAKGRACNGGSNKPVAPGTVEKISGPLRLCTCNALHATNIPPKWQGERVWLVALIGEVQWQDDKCGALQREIIGECL